MPRKILLFLVEGKSDISALEYPLGLYFSDVQPSFDLYFLKPLNENGDITSFSTVEQNTIVNKIDDWWGVSSFLSRNGFEPSDVVEIVQILDIDGVYIDDSCVELIPLKSKVEYCDSVIKCDSPARIIDRNKRKRYNITALKAIDSIKLGTTKVKYSLYYFSCNLDHFTSNNRNMDCKEKNKMAESFAYKFNEPENVYNWFNESTSHRTSVGGNYKKSWEYLKRGNNSLSACSNVIILLDKYKK